MIKAAASLLTITAGRVLQISVPTEGSNSTHHTSPRFILEREVLRRFPGKLIPKLHPLVVTLNPFVVSCELVEQSNHERI
jgi:hypothetical protein